MAGKTIFSTILDIALDYGVMQSGWLTLHSDNGIGESATKKIVELSQKNRDLHSELAKDKTRIRKLQNQLSRLQEENKTQQEKVIIIVHNTVIVS